MTDLLVPLSGIEFLASVPAAQAAGQQRDLAARLLACCASPAGLAVLADRAPRWDPGCLALEMCLASDVDAVVVAALGNAGLSADQLGRVLAGRPRARVRAAVAAHRALSAEQQRSLAAAPSRETLLVLLSRQDLDPALVDPLFAAAAALVPVEATCGPLFGRVAAAVGLLAHRVSSDVLFAVKNPRLLLKGVWAGLGFHRLRADDDVVGRLLEVCSQVDEPWVRDVTRMIHVELRGRFTGEPGDDLVAAAAHAAHAELDGGVGADRWRDLAALAVTNGLQYLGARLLACTPPCSPDALMLSARFHLERVLYVSDPLLWSMLRPEAQHATVVDAASDEEIAAACSVLLPVVGAARVLQALECVAARRDVAAVVSTLPAGSLSSATVYFPRVALALVALGRSLASVSCDASWWDTLMSLSANSCSFSDLAVTCSSVVGPAER